jgi:hypothetical protein
VPYQLSWYQENRVLFVVFSGNLTLDELEAYGRDLSNQYLNLATRSIHIISDARTLEKFPTNALYALRATEGWLRHPNMGWAILINKTANPMLDFLLAVVTKVVKLKYRKAATPEEALSMLRTLDPTLLPIES